MDDMCNILPLNSPLTSVTEPILRLFNLASYSSRWFLSSSLISISSKFSFLPIILFIFCLAFLRISLSKIREDDFGFCFPPAFCKLSLLSFKTIPKPNPPIRREKISKGLSPKIPYWTLSIANADDPLAMPIRKIGKTDKINLNPVRELFLTFSWL